MAFQTSQGIAETASGRPMLAGWRLVTSSSSSDRLCKSAFGTTPRGERDMTHEYSGTALQLYSTVKQEGILELSLADVPIPEPQEDEVVVRVEAAPINPSDLRLFFGAAHIRRVDRGSLDAHDHFVLLRLRDRHVG